MPYIIINIVRKTTAKSENIVLKKEFDLHEKI